MVRGRRSGGHPQACAPFRRTASSHADGPRSEDGTHRGLSDDAAAEWLRAGVARRYRPCKEARDRFRRFELRPEATLARALRYAEATDLKVQVGRGCERPS